MSVCRHRVRFRRFILTEHERDEGEVRGTGIEFAKDDERGYQKPNGEGNDDDTNSLTAQARTRHKQVIK